LVVSDLPARIALVSLLILADWTAPVGAIGSAVAAIAAVVAIVYAKQAADAGRDAIRQARELRREEDFRQLGRAVVELQRYADDARQMPTVMITNRMHHAQTRVRAVLVTGVRVSLSDDATKRLDAALDHHSDPVTVMRRRTRRPPSPPARHRRAGVLPLPREEA
jgi:hypothetical protein